MTTPFNDKNAIELCSFYLVFERAFNKQELQSLTRLEKVFQNEFPFFKEINIVNVQIEGDSVKNFREKISGILLQCFNDDGKPSWILKIERNIIEVSCFSYDNWTHVWQKAFQYFSETINSVESENNKIITCALKIIDKFSDSIDNYSIKNVFSSDTPYLTQNVLSNKSGKLWHIHEGWFDLSGEESTYLNTLNLSTSDEETETITVIEHIIHCQFIKKPQLALEFKNSLMTEFFSNLHNKNKNVLKSLLNANQLERINLCKV